MDEHVRANRELWVTWTPYHLRSSVYDVAGFKAGRDTLDAIDLAGLGDVRGRSVLHLQCHFGLDTLSLARRGARATGVDFDGEAIRAARALAAELGLDATFVESAIDDLPQHLDSRFDLVFTSHGVLGWLPDLGRWAQVIAHFLAPGGAFSIVEVHPVALRFDERRDDQELRLRYPYFAGPEPVREEYPGCYAVPDAPILSVEHAWLHTLGDIIGSLIRAGLRIESFEEYPFMRWRFFPWMVRRDRSWQLPGDRKDLPLMFSLRASKAP